MNKWELLVNKLLSKKVKEQPKYPSWLIRSPHDIITKNGSKYLIIC